MPENVCGLRMRVKAMERVCEVGSLRSAIELLPTTYAEAAKYPLASFDVMELGDVPVGPAPDGECYLCCAFKVVELGAVSSGGEGKTRRLVRISDGDVSTGLSVCREKTVRDVQYLKVCEIESLWV